MLLDNVCRKIACKELELFSTIEVMENVGSFKKGSIVRLIYAGMFNIQLEDGNFYASNYFRKALH